MVRFALSIALAGAFALAILPAAAQFGTIFGDPPPRPPGAIPDRAAEPPYPLPQQQYPPSQYPPQQYPPPRYPAQQYPPQALPRQQAAPPSQRAQPDGIRSQPLPPPPGGTAAVELEPRTPSGQPTLPGLPPGQRQPRGAPQPSNAALQPGDEVVAEPPSQKIINRTALFTGLDKITGRIINFDVAIGETVQFGALQVTPRACYTRPPTETASTDGFVEVDEVTLQGDVRRIFNGWMFAASPGLHAVEHPIYDVWLTGCKSTAPGVAEAKPETPAPAAAAAAQQNPPPTPRRAPLPRR